MGYSVEFRLYNTPNLNIISYGEYNYDNLLLFASSEDDLKGIKIKEITDFFDSGRNVMILGCPD